jgi:phosphomannomutase/phosphoglucomutase
MQLFGSSGTRGVVGEGLTPEFVIQVAKAAGTVWDDDRVVVAQDTRTSGDLFVSAAISGLTSIGVDVDVLGETPTPSASHYGAQNRLPVIIITASHNPPEYNGMKLMNAQGIELGESELEEIEACVSDEKYNHVSWDAVGQVREIETANGGYVDELLDAVDREQIARQKFTVALDPGHGAGALTSPSFFQRLGCTVHTINSTPDGHFPGRVPEPVESNLGDLKNLVSAVDADVGIAHDGDADRAIFIDETGEYIPGETSLAILSAAVLSEGDATVAAVNVSQRLVDVCKAVGAQLELTPVGSSKITSRVQELQSAGQTVPIAGEGNGGIFFPEYRLVRDGAYVAARFLEQIAEKPASELTSEYSAYTSVRINIEYTDDNEKAELLNNAMEYVEQADAALDTTDGYRLDYDDGWVLIRPSGTESKIRVYAEAKTEKRAETLANAVATHIN